MIGLIAVILVWALLLGSSFPSSWMTGTNRYPGVPRDDLGREAAEEYEREHGYWDWVKRLAHLVRAGAEIS